VQYSAAVGSVNCGLPQSEAKREAIFSRARSSYPYAPTSYVMVHVPNSPATTGASGLIQARPM
jgi:hypothetical protein